MPGQDERGVHYPSNGLARGRYAVVHDNQTDHRQLSFIDRLKPDFGFKKIGGFYILYESKEFNLILGPDYFGVGFTLLLVCVLSILLNQYIVASSALECGFWQIIIAAMSAGTTITFLLVALKDPGIIRKDRIPIPDEEAELERMPYCDICDLYQPTRVVHCATCNCCIVGLDHHCPYVGKCIGKGNMFFFKIFNVFWVSYFAIFIYLMIAS